MTPRVGVGGGGGGTGGRRRNGGKGGKRRGGKEAGVQQGGGGSRSAVAGVRGKLAAKNRARRAKLLAQMIAEQREQEAVARKRKQAIRAWHKHEIKLEREARARGGIGEDVVAVGDGVAMGEGNERRVSFSETMLVTEIPVEHSKVLPVAVKSPLKTLQLYNDSSDDEGCGGVLMEDDDEDEEEDPDFRPRGKRCSKSMSLVAEEDGLDFDLESEDDVKNGFDGNDDGDDDSDADEDDDDDDDNGDVDLKSNNEITGRAEALLRRLSGFETMRSSTLSGALESGNASESDPGDDDADESFDDLSDSSSEADNGHDVKGGAAVRSSSKNASEHKLQQPARPRGYAQAVADENERASSIRKRPRSPKSVKGNSAAPLAKEDKPHRSCSANGESRTNFRPRKPSPSPTAKTADVATPVSPPSGPKEDGIDSLFAGKRKKRRVVSPEPAPADLADAEDPALLWGKAGRGGRQRYTEDGLRILSEDDIKAENAGKELNGDCPFDCACCF